MNESGNNLTQGGSDAGRCLERIGWIDCARGIAMLFVVLGHCYMTLEDPVNRFVLSFHMPVFFYLSGMCAKISDVTFAAWASKKARGLLIPQLTLAVIVFVYAATSQGVSVHTLVDSLLVWFLPVLYICMLLFWWLARLANNTVKVWLPLLCFIAAAAPLVDHLGVDVCPIRPETVLASLFFFCFGYVWRLVDLEANYFSNSIMWAAVVLLMPILFALSQMNAPIAMYEGSFGSWPLFFFTATIGILWVCLLARLLEETNFLVWLGRTSIVMYVLHFRFIALLRAIVVRVLPVAGFSLGANEMAILLFVSTMVILVPFVNFCDKYLGFLFGKGFPRSSMREQA